MIKIEDEASYTMAVEKFSDSVFRLACHYMPCREDAEDVTQEVFIKLLKKMNCHFLDLEHLKAWLFRVTKNQAVDHLRKQKKQRETQLLPDSGTQEPDLLSELQDLKVEDREVLYLYYYEGYTINEIAALTRTNKNTVGSRLIRARKHLKKLLQEE